MTLGFLPAILALRYRKMKADQKGPPFTTLEKAMKEESKFMSAIKQISEEKAIPQETILKTVEAAIAAAYRKDFGQKEQNVIAEIDPKTEKARIFVVRKVVEEITDPIREIGLKEAQKIRKGAKWGDEIREEVFPPAEYGRVAAQTAKQVIMQRLREVERDMILQAYKDKEGTILGGSVQRIEGDVVFIDVGKAVGILFPSEQSRADHYRVGQRLKVFLVRVEEGGKEPQLILSRAHPEMVRKLFEMEVPEIASGVVEIKAIAREAGVRTKVAVASKEEAVDPVGSLVGRRGVRVQVVMGEIGDEKIDIVLWDKDLAQFIMNALAPAKIKEVIVNENERKALVKVDDDQLSLAIGRNGQNVRLASRLTGYQIDVEKKAREVVSAQEEKTESTPPIASDKKTGAKSSETPPQEKEKKETPEVSAKTQGQGSKSSRQEVKKNEKQ